VRSINEGGTQEAIALIGDLLSRELRDPQLTVELRKFAAAQFLHMVVALPQRRMTPGELEAWADDVVSLFLNGCRGLVGASSRQRR
jgi:hypothetical protein